MATKASTPRGRLIPWLDSVRALAILTVILCHSAEAVYTYDAASIGSAGLGSQIVAVGLFTIGRLGVPFFLFLTGYLMLDKRYDHEACVKFWKTKWLGLVVAAEIWIVIYDVFLHFVRHDALTIDLLIKNMLFLQNVYMGHMWYIPMIIGIYLLLPVMANGLKSLDNARVLVFPLVICFAVLFVLPVLDVLSVASGSGPVKTELYTGFVGGVYGFYILVGYCFKKGLFDRIGSVTALICGLLFFALTVLEQMFAYRRGLTSPVWYSNGLLFLSGFFLFLFFSKMHSDKERKIVSVLAKYSFALYLVHFPVKILLTPWIEALGLPLCSIQVMVLSFAVLAVSLPVCIGISRIPVIGRRMLYMR